MSDVDETRREKTRRDEKKLESEKPRAQDLQPPEPELPPDEPEQPPPGPPAKRTRFTPPTLAEVAAHVLEKSYTFDPQAFLGYYQARGWKLKTGVTVVDWQAACVTWQVHESKQLPQRPKAANPNCRECKKPLTKAEQTESGLYCKPCRQEGHV